jgi:CHAT domain-containing protein
VTEATGPSGYPDPLASGSERRALLRLQGAAEEIGQIKELVGDDCVVLAGDEATESSFKILCSRFNLLHLAVHAVFNKQLPAHSGLELGVDSEGREDGRLQAFEILDLPLACDLVVLSSCLSGFSAIDNDLGTLGRCFMIAGAKSVLASKWSVDDVATRELMVLFYGFLASGNHPRIALQKAKCKLIANGRRHPYYWAGFMLYGEAGTICFRKGRIDGASLPLVAVGAFLLLGLLAWSLGVATRNKAEGGFTPQRR